MAEELNVLAAVNWRLPSGAPIRSERIVLRKASLPAGYAASVALPRRESANLLLPLVAEHQDHHLLINVRVVT